MKIMENGSADESQQKSIICELKESVVELYKFNDYYFKSHDISSAKNKPKDVKDYIEKVAAFFKQHEEEALAEDRAQYYYLLGKAHNVEEGYSKIAEELLSKAVKLNPNIVDTWNQLGDVLYKKKDMAESKHCFENAIIKERNIFSLRYLSYFAKYGATNQEERVKCGDEGIKLAKEAVDMDKSDGVSWATLGNAYLVYFFHACQVPGILILAQDAYQHAVLKYRDEYKEALIALDKAVALEPWWDSPKTFRGNLMKYLLQTQDFVSSKGRMKPKRLQTLINGLSEKYLGRYIHGYKNNNVKMPLTYVPISKLAEGKNINKVISGAVVCSIYNDDDVPFTFCMVDMESTCTVVTVYNLALGKGVIIGDIVTVPFPKLVKINFEYEGKVFRYNIIRVDTPQILVVNGKNFKEENFSSVMVSSST